MRKFLVEANQEAFIVQLFLNEVESSAVVWSQLV
jgi:hypothetical protein